MPRQAVSEMKWTKVYLLLIQKTDCKGRSKTEVDTIISWLTGYDPSDILQDVTCGEFFLGAPAMNPRASLITGTVCGVRVETIEDPLMQRIRWLDKMIDELAKGKPMEKILR